MQSFSEWCETSGLRNPYEDIDQYITGLANRLMLLRPEEINEKRDRLVELQQILARALNG